MIKIFAIIYLVIVVGGLIAFGIWGVNEMTQIEKLQRNSRSWRPPAP